MHAEYADRETMREARDRYFEANGFGADGGYGEAWVDFRLGPIPLPFPNTPGRVRAVRYHDLHHVLTGYDTDPRGEFEISAWEVGAGCEGFFAAWVINLGGLVAGMLSAPRRTFAAFVRGRRSRSLYGLDVDELLDGRVGELRARHVGHADGARPADIARFVAMVAAGVVVGSISTAIFLPLVPVGIVANLLRKRQRAQSESSSHPPSRPGITKTTS
ncbi:MAG: hypothetical protein KF901_30990 [Myxococcales bacterium]|nr:hypothetical protein [Myxococcales bacterium]